MDRNTLQKILIGLFISACIFIGLRVSNVSSNFENSDVPKQELMSTSSSSRMTYGRFLEYLELGWVKQVDLYDNSRNAIVVASSPELGNRPQSQEAHGLHQRHQGIVTALGESRG